MLRTQPLSFAKQNAAEIRDSLFETYKELEQECKRITDRFKLIHRSQLSNDHIYLPEDRIGFKRISTFRKLINSIPNNELHESQFMFTDAWFKSVLPHFFSEEWENNSDELSAEFGLDDRSLYTLTIAPRRWGKTRGVCIFIFAVLIAIPGIKITVYASVKRYAEEIKRQVMRFFQLTDRERFVVGDCPEKLFIGEAPLSAGSGRLSAKAKEACDKTTTSVLWTLSAGSQARTVRGSGGDIVIFEEAAFITQTLLMAILPVLSVTNTALIAISTAMGPDNIYTKLFESKDLTGKPLFKIMWVRLVCKRCEHLDLRDSGNICPHVNVRPPPWRSLESQKRVDRFMTESASRQELSGLIVENGFYLFRPYLKDFRSCVINVNECGIRAAESNQMTIYMGIDPAESGICEFAFLSYIVIDEKPVVKKPPFVYFVMCAYFFFFVLAGRRVWDDQEGIIAFISADRHQLKKTAASPMNQIFCSGIVCGHIGFCGAP